MQLLDTVNPKGGKNFVDQLDSVELAKDLKLPLPPVMIYGDDVTHIVSEVGIAYLSKCGTLAEREAAIRSISGDTSEENMKNLEEMRRKGIIKTPEDLGIDRTRANKDLLAAKSLDELVEWSGGLYKIPAKFKK